MPMIDRSAFLYLHGSSKNFAQCKSCCLYRPTRPNSGQCVILDLMVNDRDTCGFYIPGWYSETISLKRVSPEEAGFTSDEVRCENCRYGGDKCQLYVTLNKAHPEIFDLDEEITPRSCCNAWRK